MTLHERIAAPGDARSVLGRWKCPLRDRGQINHSKLSSRPGQKKERLKIRYCKHKYQGGSAQVTEKFTMGAQTRRDDVPYS